MLIYYNYSSMATTTNLKILRLPCNSSRISLTNIPLIDIGSAGISEDDCIDFEKELEHIPNMKSLNQPISFSWAHRHLIGRTNKDVGDESLKADYMMYMCVDKSSGLPRNDRVEWIVNSKNGRITWSAPIKVYGDAFVFRKKTEPNGLGESKRANYVDMDQDFGHGGSFADCILQYLLMYPEKGEWKV